MSDGKSPKVILSVALSICDAEGVTLTGLSWPKVFNIACVNKSEIGFVLAAVGLGGCLVGLGKGIPSSLLILLVLLLVLVVELGLSGSASSHWCELFSVVSFSTGGFLNLTLLLTGDCNADLLYIVLLRCLGGSLSSVSETVSSSRVARLARLNAAVTAKR